MPAILPAIGTEIKIYYDPEDPQSRVIYLLPTPADLNHASIGFLAVIAITGAMLIFLSIAEAHRRKRPAPIYNFDREITKEDAFFLAELGSIKPLEETVLATAYLRSNSVNTFVGAFSALGHFLALTELNLFVVKTTAPAFSKPILNNRGMECIPLKQISGIEINPPTLRIIYDRGLFDF